MASRFKGSISFGLVYIPVALYPGVRRHDVGFHLIDRKTMSRVRYWKTCEDCGGKEVKQEDLVKGYEYEDGKYVIFEDKDFEKLRSKRDKDITITSFVALAEVDPIYFEKAYYVVPTGAEKAFSVLLCAMEETGRAAVAKAVLGANETLILIRAQKGRMILSTLYFADEILQNPAKEVEMQGSDAELVMAKTIIESMAAPFDPSAYHDEYRERIMEAIEQKIAGKEIAAPKEHSRGNAKDLMDALKKSLALVEKPKTKASRRTSARKKA